MKSLFSSQGLNLRSLALEGWSLNHWTAKQVPYSYLKCIALTALWDGGWIREGEKETSYEEAAGDSGRKHVRAVAAKLRDVRAYREVSEMN